MICCDKCSAKIAMGETRRVMLSIQQVFPEVTARDLYRQDFVYAPRNIEALCLSCKKELATAIDALLDEFGAEPIPEQEPREPDACEA